MNISANITVSNDLTDSSPASSGAATRDVVETVFKVLLTTLVCCVGVPANIMNCLVFRRQGLQQRMNLCLFSLAMADCAYLLSVFVVDPLPYFVDRYDQKAVDQFYIHGYVPASAVSRSLRAMCNLITMVIAVERCVCVVLPLRASRCMSRRVMAAIISLSFCLLQALHLIYVISYYGYVRDADGKKYRIVLQSEVYFEYQVFFDILLHTVLGYVFPFTVFFVISVATAVTVMTLKTTWRWQEKTANVSGVSSGRQRALTSMLVGVACVYIGTTLPLMLREILIVHWISFLLKLLSYDLFMTISAVIEWIPQINALLHCFIYYSRSASFRLHFNCILRHIGITLSKVSTSEESEYGRDNSDF